jgi:DNA-binding transcriptional MerR regulator
MPEQRISEDHTGHLSIGEVLGLLVEEFPDVTISKIRFLESQGLIDPERTASGYRKFYDDDVELLRCILREQRENYLPLKVIKDRLDSGEIDPTNENTRPRGIKNVDVTGPGGTPRSSSAARNGTDASAEPAATLDGNGAADDTSARARREHPSTGRRVSTTTAPTSPPEPTRGSVEAERSRPPGVRPSTAAGGRSPVRYTAEELCAESGLTATELGNLESYGVVAATSAAGGPLYDQDAMEIATCSKRFLDAGVDARHLRSWRVAAEREAGLFDQLIQPLLRQRNPDANREALERLRDLEEVGGRLRSVLVHSALRHLFDP